jgi:hypothetical protein
VGDDKPTVTLADGDDVRHFRKGKGYRGHFAFTPEEYWHEDTIRCPECEREDMEAAEAMARGDYCKVTGIDRERGVITLDAGPHAPEDDE